VNGFTWYKCFGGKAINRSLGRPSHRWEGNIKVDRREMGCILLAQDKNQCRALVNTVMEIVRIAV
jgi:hypothetical protein